MVETLLSQALMVLKKKGLKQTEKRKRMLSFLIEKDRYVNAKELYIYMRQVYSGISYDTIYRNLNDFILVELVEMTELQGEKKFRFHCCHGEIGHHHHFICLSCGETKELHMCPMDFFQNQLPECEIEGHRFEIYGKCEKCKTL